MKKYTSNNPVFSESIKINETTDMVQAENINAAPKQLLQNTLANRTAIERLESREDKETKNINWTRKLTSRKLWTAVASFVSMMIVATGGTDNTAAQVTALIYGRCIRHSLHHR